jgi:hypothetical protein
MGGRSGGRSAILFCGLTHTDGCECGGEEEVSKNCLPCAQWVGVGRSDVLTSLLFLWDRDRAAEAFRRDEDVLELGVFLSMMRSCQHLEVGT